MIQLTAFEIKSAAFVGVERQVQCMNVPDLVEFPWNAHIEGACAEIAFAKLTGSYWNFSVGTFRSGADVGIYQVRRTGSPNGGLKVYEKDKDNDVFVLMRGSHKVGFEFVGWSYGYEVKERGKQEGTGKYVLSPDQLKDWNSLP